MPEHRTDRIVEHGKYLAICFNPHLLDNGPFFRRWYSVKYTVIPEKRETLRLTDGLIDQIVHRLYGLAEEEKEIVVV